MHQTSAVAHLASAVVVCLLTPTVSSINPLLAQTSDLPVVLPVEHHELIAANSTSNNEPRFGDWTLQALQDIALANHPAVRRKQALVCAARGNALQAGLSPNPNIGFDGQQLGSDGRAEQYGVFIEQEIVRREKLELDQAIASHEVYRAEHELAMAQTRVLTDVRVTFFRCLRAQHQVELTRELLEIGAKSLETSSALLSAAEVGRIDVLQAELEVESTESLLRNAENRHRSNWQQLAAVTAQRDLSIRALDGDLFQPAAEIVFAQALDRLWQESPEIAVALTNIERARCYLRRQQLDPRPNVTIEGLFNWRDNGISGDADGA